MLPRELVQAFNATHVIIMVLNNAREVVFANNALYNILQIKESSQVIGRRPGEVVKCIHSDRERTGCGTSLFCTECTALGIIKKSMESNEPKSGEAVFTQKFDHNGLALNVYEHVQPIEVEGSLYYVMSLIDISDRIKRRFLERIFFHDILNTVGNLRGLIHILQPVEQQQKDIDLIKTYFDYVIEEIHAQKQVLDAENNELQPDPITLNSLEVLYSVKNVYSHLEEYKDYRIELDKQSEEIMFTCDFLLLRRVMSNMLKNALEASQKCDQVKLGCRTSLNPGRITFWVQNTLCIPEDIQKRIFERAFSTKGKGRGLGTYSIKLLGERYLKGHVDFISSPDQGTIFYIDIPV